VEPPLKQPRDLLPRRFFLRGPAGAAPPAFADQEEEHARRVLRIGPGEVVLGIDGAGAQWRCRTVADGKRLGLVPDSEPVFLPGPGEAGAPLPHITVAVPWPKGERGEGMLDRLVQLGVARIQPLLTEWTGPGERLRMPRLERITREALKQSRRAHLPEIARAITVEALTQGLWTPDGPIERLTWVLDADAPVSLAEVSRPIAPRPESAHGPQTPWPFNALIAVGPEGGFSPRERGLLAGAGGRPVGLGPHILRVETAAEAGVAMLSALFWTPRSAPKRDGADAPPGAGP